MYKIDAIIQPSKSESVRKALKEAGVEGMTVTDVRGHGRQKGHVETYRGQEYRVDYLPKVKIEMVIPKERKEEVIKVIVDTARTGHIGDGKIFVYNVGNAIRIRNDDRGEAAI
jgi:nitrogen regulatory protein P-II 1